MKPVVLATVQVSVLLASGVLLVGGFGKIVDPAGFNAAMIEHGIVPPRILGFVSRGLPWIEVFVACIGLWKLTNGKLSAACGLIGAWFGVLTIYVWAAYFLKASGKAGCGCGTRSVPIEDWLPLALQNSLVCLAMLMAGLWFYRDKKAMSVVQVDCDSAVMSTPPSAVASPPATPPPAVP